MGRHRVQKRPCVALFDGATYLNVTDTATLNSLEGLQYGIIEGSFLATYPSFTIQSTANDLDANINVQRVRVSDISENSAFIFKNLSTTGGAYNVAIKPSVLARDFFIDGKEHTFKVIINVTPSIIIDGVTYNGSMLTVSGVTKFTDTNISSLVFGVQRSWQTSLYVNDFYAKGIIYNLSIKSLNELTTYYSLTTQCQTFSASSPTTKITV